MDISTRIKAWAIDHAPTIFAILRTVMPNFKFKEFVLITRFNDVQEALSCPNVLGVTYAEKMGIITNGGNFFLGMNDTPTYTRDVSNMRIVVRRDDIPNIVAPMVEKWANEIVAQSNGKIEIVSALTSVVPCLLSAEYLGIPGPSREELFKWASSMFHYLFYPGNPKEVDDTAIGHSAQTRAYLDQLIALRKQQIKSGQEKDDVIGRCLKLQQAGTPGMTDLDIRNNLIGIIIGMLPTTSKCAVLVLDYLLDHPALLAGAQQAALANNDEILRKYVLESLRLNSFGAGVLREALTDYVIAKGTFRSKEIPKGTTIFVATQSAMLDGRVLENPTTFRLDRPDGHYMHFGYGMHTCFGQYINMVQIPLIVKSLLKCKNLRRAAGDAGKVQYEQPYPVRFYLEFDRETHRIAA